MKTRTGAALAAVAVFAGSALLSPAVMAEDAEGAEKAALSAIETNRLQHELDARAARDAEAIAADAIFAASQLDLTVGLDKRPVSLTSVLLVSER